MPINPRRVDNEALSAASRLREAIGSAIIPAVGVQSPDLPEWEFSVDEISPGVYRVRATRDGGISGEATAVEPDAALEDLKGWAKRVDAGHSHDRSK